MDDRQIALLNRMIAFCIDCGGDSGGPYWTNTDGTFDAILDFLRTFRGYKLGIRYIPFEKFEIYRIGRED